MSESKRATDSELAVELQQELRRLESERSRAIDRREQIIANVETGDDTGHFLIVALENIKRVGQRIEQVSRLLTKEQERAHG